MFLEHVNLTVSDLQRSIDFYCKLFDFRVRWRADAEAEKQETHVGSKDFYIALFQAPQSGIADVDYQRIGLNHFGIVVDDLDKYRERLSRLGIKPHYEPAYPPGRRFYFYDPDRVEIELVQYESGA